ncbi:tudor and KH domain-containing protein homolog isoform X2 [Ostrinia furnacalis]|uniref:tudor and KH domain-containing protein homolog isoform X2 n=1 Tax=Ostrinia furnacalis TaxID=93504 RepID=UPI00103B04D3|nr:tudor and KH domain-containing protein homolog isoform X2 [Ostrinia furnacalis]
MSFNSRILLPVALGMSLVSVTAFVVYYVFKKDEEEKNENLVKTSRINVIEINIPKSIVPALIGRSGSNIKEIERKSGALIHFKKFSDKDYDVCIVRGRSEASQLAETLIHDFIKEQPLIVDDRIEVPGWACGRIIGVGGENINDISHRSGARVKIDGPNLGDRATQRQVSIKGTKEQIEVAKGLIEKCVAQEKCRREIEQSKRSPRHGTPAPETPDDAPAEASGASIEVYVSAVSSPSRFWVQFVGAQVSQLDELVAHMTDYYGSRENRQAHELSQVSVGQVVAAVFRHDGRWYRARVHAILPNEFDATKQVADVFFVDYGDSEYVAVNELCELRADLLRLRFQAMECFLAGVKPAGKEADVVGVTAAGATWDKWHPQAIERFEELTQVARWKSLVSRTCTYKKTATAEGEKEKEIPGIKLYDVTDEGEIDIGAVLVAEGWAVEGAAPAPRASHTPQTPFGDLGNSRVLGMLNQVGPRSSSLPKDHKDDGTEQEKAAKDKLN